LSAQASKQGRELRKLFRSLRKKRLKQTRQLKQTQLPQFKQLSEKGPLLEFYLNRAAQVSGHPEPETVALHLRRRLRSKTQKQETSEKVPCLAQQQ
jgi:hypothetical protein